MSTQLAAKQQYNLNKLQKRLRANVIQAIDDYAMIEPGDKVMVCLSGGKDSYTLLDMLLNLKQYHTIPFDLIAVNLDQKQPGFPAHILPDYLASLGVPYHIIEQDTYSVVTNTLEAGKTMCSLCSRLRRGALYQFAHQFGATKVALGHHRDDMVETLFLNMFYGGKLKAMPAKLLSDNKQHVLIRPLAYCREKDIQRYAQHKQFPIIPCNLCGSQPNMQRQAIKQMLQDWDKQFPGRVETIFNSMQHLVPEHLHDLNHFNFKDLQAELPDNPLHIVDLS